MRKKTFLATILFTFAASGFAQTTRIINVVEEHNGRLPWWDIFEVAKPRYKDIEPTISFATSPDGETIEIHHLICNEPGYVKCRWSAVDRTPSTIEFNGFSINRSTLEENIDEMLDDIDSILFNTGQYTGSVTRKISFRQNNQLLVILLRATWINGTSNCDADITFDITDVTQFVDLY